MSYRVNHSFYTPLTFSSSCTLHKGWWCSNACQILPSEACLKGTQVTAPNIYQYYTVVQNLKMGNKEMKMSLSRYHFKKKGACSSEAQIRKLLRHWYYTISGSAEAGHMTCPRSYCTMHSMNLLPTSSQHHMTHMSFQEDNLH